MLLRLLRCVTLLVVMRMPDNGTVARWRRFSQMLVFTTLRRSYDTVFRLLGCVHRRQEGNVGGFAFYYDASVLPSHTHVLTEIHGARCLLFHRRINGQKSGIVISLTAHDRSFSKKHYSVYAGPQSRPLLLYRGRQSRSWSSLN